MYYRCPTFFSFQIGFLLFFPGPTRFTVELLCFSLKALYLPVITSHPSLCRLLRVKASCALCAPSPHPLPSLPSFFRHVVTAAIMLTAPQALHLKLVAEACANTDAVVTPGSSCLHCGTNLLTTTSQCPIHQCLNPVLFTRARQGGPCLNRMHLVCLPAQDQGQSSTWLLCHSGLTYGSVCQSCDQRSAQALCVQVEDHFLWEFTTHSQRQCPLVEMDGDHITLCCKFSV